MPTNTAHSNPYAHLVGAALGSYQSDLVRIEDGATCVTFAFDAEHLWLDAKRLETVIEDEGDGWVLECELFGGRAGPASRFIGNARRWLDIPDAIADPKRWRKMIGAAVRQWDRRNPKADLEEFAELLEEIFMRLHPIEGHIDELLVEVRSSPGPGWSVPRGADSSPRAGNTLATSAPGTTSSQDLVEWVHPRYEALISQAGVIVDRIEVTYPGHGNDITMVITGEERTETFTITVPSTEDAADLLDLHYNNDDDPEASGPVLAELASLDGDVLDAALDLAETDDALCVCDRDGAPTGAMVKASDANLWTLLAAVTPATGGR